MAAVSLTEPAESLRVRRSRLTYAYSKWRPHETIGLLSHVAGSDPRNKVYIGLAITAAQVSLNLERQLHRTVFLRSFCTVPPAALRETRACKRSDEDATIRRPTYSFCNTPSFLRAQVRIHASCAWVLVLRIWRDRRMRVRRFDTRAVLSGMDSSSLSSGNSMRSMSRREAAPTASIRSSTSLA